MALLERVELRLATGELRGNRLERREALLEALDLGVRLVGVVLVALLRDRELLLPLAELLGDRVELVQTALPV